MKILVIGHTYINPINHGKWLTWSKRFPEDDLCIITPKKWKDSLHFVQAKNDLHEKNLQIRSFKTFFNFKERTHFYSWKFWKFLHTYDPQIVHVEQGQGSFQLLLIIFFKNIFLKKFKISFFSWINWKQSYFPILREIESFNISYSDGFIAGNLLASQLILKKNPQLIYQTSPLMGVDSIFFNVKKCPVALSNSKIKFSFFGRFVHEKGIFDLLEAFQNLESSNNELFFFGSGPLLSMIKNYMEKNKRIFYGGILTHQEIPFQMSQMDVVILPSKTTKRWAEQLGHVLLEAFCLKKLTIGSSSQAIKDVIGDCGLIFKEGDSLELKEKMEFVQLNPQACKAFIDKAFIRYQNLFSNESICDQTKSFFEALTKF